MARSANPPTDGLSVHQQAATLRGVLIAGAVAIASVGLVSLMLKVDPTLTLWTYGTGLLLHLAHLGWLQSGNVKRVAVSHCISYMLWVSLVLALRYGGLRSPAALVYPPLILVAGLVWSGRAALGMAILTSGIGGLLVLLEKEGVLVASLERVTPERLWLLLTACVFITAVVLRYALNIIHRSVAATLLSDRRYAELVESAPDAMLFCDRDGTIRACNAAASELWGCESSWLLGQRIRNLLANPADAPRVLRAQAATPALELDIRNLMLEVIPVEVRVRPASTQEDEPAVHLTVRDIRERRASAQERDRLENQLRQAQRLEALGRLAGGVAHDFNNLLTIILGNVNFLRPAATERAARAVESIEEATARATDLTRQLLAMGRRQVFESDVVDLNNVLSSVRGMLRRLLPEDVAFETTPCDQPCWVAADHTQLSQVVVNLVTNARDAVRPGGRIAVKLEAEDNSIVLTVNDDGVGMTDTVQAHLFEPFFTTKESAGTGLGLATVHGIISQLGGQIAVKSAEGKGSTFTIHLPRAAAPSFESASDAPPPSLPPSGAVTVLVVEDDAPVREVVCAMLRSVGYRVVDAENASSAEQAAERAGRVDLVVSDVVLNDSNGPAVVASLSKRWPRLKVLFVSGHAEGLIAQRGMLRPGTHFLAKPFSQQALIAKVAHILTGSSTRHEIPAPIQGP
ncbi:MAG TPA: ATP-binding protein [Polyangiaceae bacterium]|nr:ATP-binding protein [Polyangiaceae bacterium]